MWEDVRNRREDGEEGEKQEYDNRAEGQVRKHKETGQRRAEAESRIMMVP